MSSLNPSAACMSPSVDFSSGLVEGGKMPHVLMGQFIPKGTPSLIQR